MELASEYQVSNSPSPTPVSLKRKLHKKKTLVIPKVCFSRLVKELTNKSFQHIIWNTDAMEALQEASEDHLHNRFEKCHQLSKLCKKHTVTKDIFDFLKE